MPRDKRLWMTFPIDMHRHPKITRLSVTARWAFVEMNGEARLRDNDGVFDAVDAEHEWSKKVLDQLVASHPTRPLVQRVGETYRIREFGEHQETRADREARVERNRRNGGKGGRPKKENPVGSDSVATRSQAATENNPESESESEIETEPSKTSSVSQEGNRARNAGLTDQGIVSIIKTVELHCDLEVSESEAASFAHWAVAKSNGPVQHPAAYARRSIEQSPTDAFTWFTKHRRHLKAVSE